MLSANALSLLERTKAAIIEGPFYMGSWCECIGHHLVNEAGVSVVREGVHMIPVVADLLGVSPDAAVRLCYVSSWPKEFWVYAYHRDKGNACRRIDFFIATNGTDELELVPQPEEELVCA